jgi:hypothetical protein
VIPTLASGPLAGYVPEVEKVADGRLAAVYVVGGAALGDFSERQSNIDLVVVCDPPLPAEEVGRLTRAERRLARAGRPAAVWHTGWDEIADGPAAGDPSGGRHPLETPLTRSLLSEEAIAYTGPDWPVVQFDEGEYRRWCRRALEELAGGDLGVMLLRRGVSPLVLQAARLAMGATTGRSFSKSEAGDAAISLVPNHFRRILHDAAGYRRGATTSMYWGPFERKYDARQLLRQLLEAVKSSGV